MTHATIAVAAGSLVAAWLIALVLIRGRRRWLQTMYAACGLAFLVMGIGFVGLEEGFLDPARQDIVLGTLLLAHALTAILVVGLIHGETLPRRRAAAFLLLGPMPVLAVFAPAEGWTLETAYDGNPVGGYLVLCLGIALAETVYARLTSRLYAAQSFWLSLGVVALFVGGPIYTYELQALGLPLSAGANVAAPVALGTFALVILQADPLPSSSRIPRGPWRGTGSLRAGEAIVFEEARPTYAIHTARTEAAAGRPTLVVARSAPPLTASGLGTATIPATRHAAVRLLTTASEFLAAHPGGLVVIPALADVVARSGRLRAFESVIRLKHAVKDTHSSVVLSTALLTDSERQNLKDLRLTWWSLPEPRRELDAILSQSFGSGAPRLLEAFCRAHGLRPDDLSTDHVPALIAFLQRTIAELTGAVEGSGAHGLRVQVEAASSVLRSFAALDASEVARGRWPSRGAPRTDEDLLVTAADYWKGKEMEELFASADAVSEREPLYERARAVFVEELGDAGEGVLRTQIARLGKRPEDLEKGDIVRIADRATVDLATLADVVDLPKEKDRLARQIDEIRVRLERLVREDA